MSKTITQNAYLQLEGLAALGRRHNSVVIQCEQAMKEILDADKDEAIDVIYGDRDVAWLLDRLDIKVEHPTLILQPQNPLEEEFFRNEGGRPQSGVAEG